MIYYKYKVDKTSLKFQLNLFNLLDDNLVGSMSMTIFNFNDLSKQAKIGYNALYNVVLSHSF